MERVEQLIKELQMLVGNPEMDKIIDEKLWDTWRDAHQKADTRWIERINKMYIRLKAHMPEEEKQRMEKTHFFFAGDEDDPECNYCGISSHEMYDWPQYCLTKEEKEKE